MHARRDDDAAAANATTPSAKTHPGLLALELTAHAHGLGASTEVYYKAIDIIVRGLGIAMERHQRDVAKATAR